MDATAIYYTLSTVAQTLAGALAILVAVVLFKLTALRSVIDTGKDTLRSYSLEPAVYWSVLRDHGYQAMAERALKDLNYEMSGNRDLERAGEAARVAYEDWGRINYRLGVVLAFSVVNITLCFVALPFTPAFAFSRPIAWAILGDASGLGVTCVALYLWLIAGTE